MSATYRNPIIEEIVAISDLPRTIYGNWRDVKIECGVVHIYYVETFLPTKYTFFAMEKGSAIRPDAIYKAPAFIRNYGDVDIFVSGEENKNDYFTD